jgi:acyl dehydratase
MATDGAAPGQTDVVEVSGQPAGLYRAAALGVLRLPRPSGLPETTLVRRGVGTDLARLADYDRVCGYRLADTVPATWPHILAFPLAMKLMSGRDFPFPVIGLVHIANRIEQLRPISADEALDLAVHAADLRPHDRGRQFDVLASATVAGQVVWRGVSTYLRKGSGGETRPDVPRPAHTPPPAPGARWRVERAVGREYAEVSGDRNPIHTSRLGARVFGFARPIAHGMWSLARCLAALEGRLPDAYAVEVSFKLPILLPATVAFAASRAGDDWRFALHDAGTGKPHLSGTVTPTP